MAAQSARSAVNSLLAPVHNVAMEFFAAIRYVVAVVAFIAALSLVAIPLGHYVWTFWAAAVASGGQWPTPAKTAVKR